MQEFLLFMPEAYLLLTLAGLVFAEIAYRGERTRVVVGTTLLGLGTAFIQVLFTYKSLGTKLFGGSIVIDGISIFFKLFLLVLAVLAAITVYFSAEIRQSRRTEYFVFLVAAALAMCLVVCSVDLLLIFLGCQLMCVIGYFAAGYAKEEVRSTEAAIKFLVFGAVASVFFLFGIAILFTLTHTLNIYEIHAALAANPIPRETGLLVFVLIFLALSFFAGVFPMYLWVPDVIEGAPTPSGIYLGLGIPTVGIAVAIRFFLVVFGGPGAADVAASGGQLLTEWPQIVALVSGTTMVVGSLLALRQQGAKRLVSALLVAHMGFLMMGLLVLNHSGVAALLYCLLVDLFSLAGIFGVFSFFFDRLGSDRLSDFRGMLAKSLPECLCLVFFLASFVGFPPLPGFIGRFALVDAIVEREWFGLAALAVGSSLVSVAVFGRLCFQLMGQYREYVGNTNPPLAFVPRQRAFLILLLVPVGLLSIFAEPILYWTGRSLELILG
ncbi:MAG: NADH-quinone oxidoreductase subunit N [Bacteriovoracia bacterium]